MNMKRTAPGYILVLTLIIISLAVVLVSFVTSRVTVYVPISHTTVERQKALMLAHGGVQLAISQLAYADVKTEETVDQSNTSTQKEAANPGVRVFLKNIEPHLNVWQTIPLTAARDGLDGEIKICIMAEDGKINVNELYDFEKHAFVQMKKQIMPAPAGGAQKTAAQQTAKKEAEENETEKFFEALFANVQKTVGGEKLFDAFATFLKNRQDKLRDVTELLKIREFVVFKNALYYEPSEAPSKEANRIFLTDLFTLSSGKRTIDPLCISTSVARACGLEENPEAAKDEQSKKAENLKQFTGAYNWPQDWDKYFKNRYNKDLSALPAGCKELLAARFEPTVFAVLVSGTVGRITERVYALLVRNRPPRESKYPARVSVLKMYRI